jgi:UDP-glucose 4-epimerase
MSKVLITGGLGFVGGRLAKKLSGQHEVIVSSRSVANAATLQAHGSIQHIEHRHLLSAATFPAGIQTVIHLAALNEIDCVRQPSEAIRVNIDETRIILENSIVAGVTSFFYFSTAHIYGSPLQGNIDELVLPVPVHPYAITHKAAEDYVVAATQQKKIQGVVIRLSNSFGSPVVPTVNRWSLLANDLGRQAIEKGKLVLSSNGCQYRDFVCLTDVENVIAAMVHRQPAPLRHSIYNLGSGVAVKVLDMAQLIAANYHTLFGKTLPVELPAGAVPTTEPSLHFSIDRLLQEQVVIKNDINAELQALLLFCHQNFKGQ